jgi:hypothetical protein
MNAALAAQRIQCQQFGLLSVRLKQRYCAFGDPVGNRAAAAIERSIRLEGYLEQRGERSLRVASGQANLAERRHTRHDAIVDRRSEPDSAKRSHSPFLLRSDLERSFVFKSSQRTESAKSGRKWRARERMTKGGTVEFSGIAA